MSHVEPLTMHNLMRAVEILDLRLVPYRGCLLRESAFDPTNVATWLENTGGDVAAVERVVNHLHLYDEVDGLADADFAEVEALGRRIAELWTDTLKIRYAEYRTVVTYASEPEEYGPTLTLHQDLQY